MEMSTKYAIGAGILGAGILGYVYRGKLFPSKAAATTTSASTTTLTAADTKKLGTQMGLSGTSAQGGSGVPAVLVMNSDGSAAISVPVGTVIVPTSVMGSQWDKGAGGLLAAPGGVLSPGSEGTVIATAPGKTVVSATAVDAIGNAWPVSATVTVV